MPDQSQPSWRDSSGAAAPGGSRPWQLQQPGTPAVAAPRWRHRVKRLAAIAVVLALVVGILTVAIPFVLGHCERRDTP